MQYYINGKFVSSSKANIAFNDSGFLYGDGLFETMRFDGKNIFSYEKHIKRLFQGLDIINLEILKDYKYCENILDLEKEYLLNK